jgi:hypothetical protein
MDQLEVYTCIDFDAEYSKAGYKTLIIRNPDGDIFLEKE